MVRMEIIAAVRGMFDKKEGRYCEGKNSYNGGVSEYFNSKFLCQ